MCCRAAQRGILGQPFTMTVKGVKRCAECNEITKRNGQPGFQFRWHKGQECGIQSGCQYLGNQGGGGAGLPANIAQF